MNHDIVRSQDYPKLKEVEVIGYKRTLNIPPHPADSFNENFVFVSRKHELHRRSRTYTKKDFFDALRTEGAGWGRIKVGSLLDDLTKFMDKDDKEVKELSDKRYDFDPKDIVFTFHKRTGILIRIEVPGWDIHYEHSYMDWLSHPNQILYQLSLCVAMSLVGLWIALSSLTGLGQ